MVNVECDNSTWIKGSADKVNYRFLRLNSTLLKLLENFTVSLL